MKFEFPKSITTIDIINVSHVTQELPAYFLGALSAANKSPNLKIQVVNSFNDDWATTLYIICNAASIGNQRLETQLKYFIAYQLEPITDRYYLDNENYLNFLKSALWIWDYNPQNVLRFQSIGLKNISYFPMGYNSSLSSLELASGFVQYSNDHRDIDVLFLGFIDPYPRRVSVITTLQQKGYSVFHTCALDPQGMKEIMKRSKIVLNMHIVPDCPLATIRLAITLANQCCIVSENSNDPELDDLYRKGSVEVVSYDQLVPAIESLLANFEKKRTMAESSYKWFSTERQLERIVDLNEYFPFN